MTPRHPVPEHRDLGRRAFLARAGLLGAAVGVGGLLPRSALTEGAFVDSLDKLVDRVGPLLNELGRDTWNGFCTLVAAGADSCSPARQAPREEAGAVPPRVPECVLDALNDFAAFPQQLARPIATAVATGISDAEIAPPSAADELLPSEVVTLDRALQRLISSEAGIPLSVSVAMLLNLVATRVNPTVVQGPFHSPFARLTSAEKARAVSLMEGAESDPVSLLGTNFPEQLKDSVSGALKSVCGALPECVASGGHSGYTMFDPWQQSHGGLADGGAGLAEVLQRRSVWAGTGTDCLDRPTDQRPARGIRIVRKDTSR